MEEIIFKMTSWACPEQYDAFLDGKQVGYLRLRHGDFRVDFPDCGGETIYESHLKGDGIFDDDEREFYLQEAKNAIIKRITIDKKLDELKEEIICIDDILKCPKCDIPFVKVDDHTYKYDCKCLKNKNIRISVG